MCRRNYDPPSRSRLSCCKKKTLLTPYGDMSLSINARLDGETTGEALEEASDGVEEALDEGHGAGLHRVDGSDELEDEGSEGGSKLRDGGLEGGEEGNAAEESGELVEDLFERRGTVSQHVIDEDAVLKSIKR